MPTYPTTFPVTGPATWGAEDRPWYEGGSGSLVFDDIDLTKLKGVWAPFRAVPGYHGPLGQARRADTSAAADWYTVENLRSHLAGTTGLCAAKYDQAGNGHHVVQATTDCQPGLTLLAGGLIELEFDGINDFLLRDAQVVSGAAPFDLIVCSDQSGETQLTPISSTRSDAHPTRVALFPHSGDTWRMGTANDAGTIVAAESATVAVPTINVARGGFVSTAQAYVQVYGRAAQTAAISGTFTLARLSLGRQKTSALEQYFVGSLRFAAACQPRLSDAEWALVASRLASRLGATVES